MRWKPSSPNSASAGFTLVELLVAAAIALALLGLAFGLVISNRRVYHLDRARTAVNQNLRAALDLIGADIRQAGERLPASFPAVLVVDGGSKDELALRKNLLDEVLPVCKDVNGNQDVVFINAPGSSPPSNPACVKVDDNGNGWDDRHEAWRDYRCRQDGVPGCQGNEREVARVYIYDPVDDKGEWFTYDADDMSQFKVHKQSTAHWTHNYDADHHPRLYLLQERRYRLTGDVLELVLNGDATHPLKLVDRIQRFEVTVKLQGEATPRTSFEAGDPWTRIEAVNVELEAEEGYGRGKSVVRALSGRYFPRNVLSH